VGEPLLDYKVRLEVFEGPLDLLLYLIKKEEIDIYDIPISRITEQYLQYLDLMRDLNLDIAGEFILMAATLAHIKSKELLPKDPNAKPEEEEEGDPRAELVRRLLEYQKYKAVAEELGTRPLLGRDTFGKGEANVPDRSERSDIEKEGPLEVSLFALLDAFRRVMQRLPPETFHEIEGDTVSVAEKAHWLAEVLALRGSIAFHDLFREAKKKTDVVATFLALLEMVRMKLVAIHQAMSHGAIQIRSKIPEGLDVMRVLSGTDLEKAFAYGISAKTVEPPKEDAGAAPPETSEQEDQESE
jgi:segregation and condensation protein A